MRTFKTREEALAFVMDGLLWGAAAGTCKDGKLARRFARTGMKIVSYGSIAAERRLGNPGDNFWFDEWSGNGINALGVPCRPFEEHLAELPEIRAELNTLRAELWVSITAGDTFDPQEYHNMAAELEKHGAADVIEGNFSCGNIKINGVYKPIVCYDLDLFDKGVEALCRGAGKRKKAVKLTPTTERRFLIGNVESCLNHGVDYIVVANTVPNSYLEKPDGRAAISMVRGGLSGRALIPIVTGMIQMIKPELKGTEVELIAAGGVLSGAVAYNYLKHGAKGFVCGTQFWRNNLDPRAMEIIIIGDESLGEKGLVDLLFEHGLPY